jgi:hypothetical protein
MKKGERVGRRETTPILGVTRQVHHDASPQEFAVPCVGGTRHNTHVNLRGEISVCGLASGPRHNTYSTFHLPRMTGANPMVRKSITSTLPL